MIKAKRHRLILSMLCDAEIVGLDELGEAMPEVSRVTLRRDIAELAADGRVRRTRGGAALADGQPPEVQAPNGHPAERSPGGGRNDELRVVSTLDGLDAIILPPISGRGADALRRQIRRRGLPFLAESAPQDGGIYLGPDNRRAARELGVLAGRRSRARSRCSLLLITHDELSNARERAEGFEAGIRESFDGELHVVRVDGKGHYKSALRPVQDALEAREPIDIVFGVNDHSALAGCDAAERTGRAVSVYAVGGERADFIARVADDGPLDAVAAFFPSVVGRLAIDRLARFDADVPDAVGGFTPHVIVTADNLHEHYERSDGGEWSLRPDVFEAIVGPAPGTGRSASRRDRCRAGAPRLRRIGFMPHYPAHDWYRTMTQAMRLRAAQLGMTLAITPPHEGIADEIRRLQRQIAAAALDAVAPGETIIIGEGGATLALADALRRVALSDPARIGPLTAITNSLDVLERLEGSPGVRTLLTSGEYQRTDRCLVGPSLGALFERMRADRAFLGAAGVSRGFGVSCADERRALAASRFIDAARSTIVLADHTRIGTDANHRIARIDAVDVVITDDGSLPIDRQSLREAGVEVRIAASPGDQDTEPVARDTHARAAARGP